MITKHLSDSAIQQYAINRADCDKDIILHIDGCDACRTRVAEYQALFTGLKEQPAPVFDFDLAANVLAQLPAEAKVTRDTGFIYGLVALAAVALIIPIFIFRSYVLHLFSGSLPIFIYLSLTVAVIFLIFQGVELYQKYNKKIAELSFY